MINPIQKKVMTKKLTEFVNECDNDEALTFFLNQTIQAKLAHSSKDKQSDEKMVFIIYNDGKTSVYPPQALIEEILDTVDTNIIRNTVHHIKGSMEYKKRINHFI